MASQIIFKDRILLCAGLEWRVLSSNSPNQALREVASGLSSSHAVVVSVTRTPNENAAKNKKTPRIDRSAGIYISPDDRAPERKTHSLAAAFIAWASSSNYAAGVLCVSFLIGDDVRYAVVVYENGLPVIDEIRNSKDEAFQLCAKYNNLPIFADDPVAYPDSIVSDDLLPAIAQAVNKTTLIAKVPVNVVKMVLVGTTLITMILGYQYWTKQQATVKKQLARAEALANDPAPRYTSALNMQRLTAGITADSLKAAYDKALTLPMQMAGWDVKQIACMQATGCIVSLDRKVGTYPNLEASAKAFGLSLLGNETPNLDRALLRWDQKLEPSPIKDTLALTTFLQTTPGATLQIWKTAGLTVQLQPVVLWPTVPGMPSGFKPANAIFAGKIEINSIALPQLKEVLGLPSPSIVWQGFVIDAGDRNGDILGRAKARVIGNYYVN